MNQNEAQQIYAELLSLHESRTYPQQKYLDLGRIMERVIRGELPSYYGKNLCECMNELYGQKSPGKDLVDRSHKCRMKNNAVKHKNDNPTGVEYEAFLSVVLELVAYYSSMPVPKNLRNFVGRIVAESPIRRTRQISLDDLADNPAKRIPVVICLDTSGSMCDKLVELKRSLIRFCEAINQHPMAKRAVELALVEFNLQAKCIFDYAPVAKHLPDLKALHFVAHGSTSMGAAVTLALQQLTLRKQRYKEYGVSYHQPWLVLMTDGAPTDNIDEACRQVAELVQSRSLSTIPVGIGTGYNVDVLRRFCSPFVKEPIRLTEVEHISEFFEFLRSSVDELLK